MKMKFGLILATLGLCAMGMHVVAFAEETDVLEQQAVEADMIDEDLIQEDLSNRIIDSEVLVISLNESESKEIYASVNESQKKVANIKLNKDEHVKYMTGNNEGLFQPNTSLTKAETASLIYSLITDFSETEKIQETTFSDVSVDKWYANAIHTLASYGVFAGKDGKFSPDTYISRAEFISALSKFEELESSEKRFADVSENHWAYREILSAAEKGWISGYSDGTFHPDGTLTRAEAVTVLNKVLERKPDLDTIFSSDGIRIFPDVEKDFWAYGSIMEATIGHKSQKENGFEKWTDFTREKTVLTPGYHVIQGALYYVDPNSGDFVTNQYVKGHQYDSMGKYVTGNPELDVMIRAETKKIVKPAMSQHDMLRAAYNYLANASNYSYRKEEILPTGATGWEERYAIPMFQKHKGNCYSYASVFYYLCKNIGYEPKTVAGTVGQRKAPHGWVEIMIDGTTYLYDPELAMANRKTISLDQLFEVTYADTPYVYSKH